MATIIALRGKHDSGKTETIRILHDLLLNNGYRVVQDNFSTRIWDFETVFSKKERKLE